MQPLAKGSHITNRLCTKWGNVRVDLLDKNFVDKSLLTGDLHDDFVVEKITLGVPRDPIDFCNRCFQAGHPRSIAIHLSDQVQSALKANFEDEPHIVAKRRAAFFQKWSGRARALKGDENKLLESCPEHVKKIMKGKTSFFWKKSWKTWSTQTKTFARISVAASSWQVGFRRVEFSPVVLDVLSMTWPLSNFWRRVWTNPFFPRCNPRWRTKSLPPLGRLRLMKKGVDGFGVTQTKAWMTKWLRSGLVFSKRTKFEWYTTAACAVSMQLAVWKNASRYMPLTRCVLTLHGFSPGSGACKSPRSSGNLRFKKRISAILHFRGGQASTAHHGVWCWNRFSSHLWT